MAASYVTRESAKKLESMGLDLDVYESLVTVTCLRNALEAMEAKRPSAQPNAFKQFIAWAHDRHMLSSNIAIIDLFTDAEAMAGAVIEYMEWRREGSWR